MAGAAVLSLEQPHLAPPAVVFLLTVPLAVDLTLLMLLVGKTTPDSAAPAAAGSHTLAAVVAAEAAQGALVFTAAVVVAHILEAQITLAELLLLVGLAALLPEGMAQPPAAAAVGVTPAQAAMARGVNFAFGVVSNGLRNY
jgi:hypothetical protein